MVEYASGFFQIFLTIDYRCQEASSYTHLFADGFLQGSELVFFTWAFAFDTAIWV